MNESFELSEGRADEVNLFHCMSSEETFGTAYDYLLKFPGFDSEIYFLLQCATRGDADPDDVIAMCQDMVDIRQEELLSSFGKSQDSIELDSYELPDTNISLEPLCLDESEQLVQQ